MTIIWYMVPEIWSVTGICFVILGHFLPFYRTNNPIWNYEKKAWRYHHFTQRVQKIVIICYIVPEIYYVTDVNALVEISFDKVVSHLFSDSMSLVTHKAPPWLALSRDILKIWPVQITGNCYLRFLQRFVLSSFAASNWWLWIWVPVKDYFLKFLHWKIRSNQVKLNFDMQPPESNMVKSNKNTFLH